MNMVEEKKSYPLIRYRDKRGFKAGALCDWMGWRSYDTLAKYERHPERMNYDQLTSMAKFYGLTLNELFDIAFGTKGKGD